MTRSNRSILPSKSLFSRGPVSTTDGDVVWLFTDSFCCNGELSINIIRWHTNRIAQIFMKNLTRHMMTNYCLKNYRVIFNNDEKIRTKKKKKHCRLSTSPNFPSSTNTFDPSNSNRQTPRWTSDDMLCQSQRQYSLSYRLAILNTVNQFV